MGWSRAARQQLSASAGMSATTVVSAAGALLFAYCFWNIASLVNPPIGPLVDPATGQDLPTLRPLWPQGAQVRVVAELALPSQPRTRKHNPLLTLIDSAVPFDTTTGMVEKHVRLCSAEGFRQLGACHLDNGIAEGSLAPPTQSRVTAEQRKQVRHLAKALQRGSPVEARVSLRLDAGDASAAGVPAPLTALEAAGGPVQMVRDRVFEPQARRSFLLTGRSSKEEADAAEVKAAIAAQPWMPRPAFPSAHFVSALDVSVVCDHTVYPALGVPPQLLPSMTPVREMGVYAPAVLANPVDPASDKFAPLNGTFTTVGLHVRLQVVPPSRFVLTNVMSASLRSLEASSSGSMKKELDDVSRLVTETPVWLLATTMAVSVLHLWLDTLAIKSDIEFWAQASSLRGLSVATLAAQAASEAIITLYLWDEGASLLVFGPSAAFAAIQVWKLLRALGVELDVRWGALPKLRTGGVLAGSAKASRTSDYDTVAISHVGLAIAPLIVGGTLFSLLWQEHTSWWHWALQTAVSVVYGLGFAMMTPQLYVNYKLRSVAALNWQALVYRTIGTFIDDLFAFVIRAPLMHRLSVFRDDAVFVVYLYQRWSYPVDASRRDTGSAVTDATPTQGQPKGSDSNDV